MMATSLQSEETVRPALADGRSQELGGTGLREGGAGWEWS